MLMPVLLMLAADELLLLLLCCFPSWFNPFLLYLTERKEPVTPPRELLTQQLTIGAYRHRGCVLFFSPCIGYLAVFRKALSLILYCACMNGPHHVTTNSMYDLSRVFFPCLVFKTGFIVGFYWFYKYSWSKFLSLILCIRLTSEIHQIQIENVFASKITWIDLVSLKYNILVML